MDEIRIIHLADIHLGYTGPANLIFGEEEPSAGRYVREVDIEQSVKRITKQIIEAQPAVDVVLIAGDLFHRSAPLPRAVRAAARMVNHLTRNGIEVVIIDGNHETSSWRHTGSPTSYLIEFGAHVINGAEWRIIQDADWRLKTHLRGCVAIHALPCRAVDAEAIVGLSPVPGHINVLLAHGRVVGMDDLNSLGHAAPRRIPPDVLRRGWDYIALGEWHMHGRKPLSDAPAYYSGSIEALNFGEASTYPTQQGDENRTRGALDIRLSGEGHVVVHSLENAGRRPVLRLDPIDASELEGEALLAEIRQRLDARLPTEAIVKLPIKRVPLTVWDSLDHNEIDRLRQLVRRCEIEPEIIQPDLSDSEEVASEASLLDQWQEFVAQQLADETERTWYRQQGEERIKSARELALDEPSRADG